MTETILTRPATKLVGIQCRTNNKTEMSAQGKIPQLWQNFYKTVNPQLIKNIAHPERVLAIYKDYEIDHTGDYTLFIGFEVSDFETTQDHLIQCEISEQKYIQFTSRKGKFPDVVIELWQKIWSLQKPQLGAERAYKADIEVYDSRAQDPMNAQIDILISI